MSIRLAVVGLGMMGRYHVQKCHELSEVELVAVCDNCSDRASDIAKGTNATPYTSLERLLDNETLDGVCLATPTSSHFDLTQQILSRGLHVLVEKPLSTTVSESDALIRLAKEKDLILMVGYIERFNPAIQKLKECLVSGELGEIVSLISKRLGPFPSRIKDTDVIVDVGVHDVDIFSYLLEQYPLKAQCYSGSALTQEKKDHAIIALDYGGVTGIAQVNWITPIKVRELSVTCTQGYAHVNFLTQELTISYSKYTKSVSEDGFDSINFEDCTPQDVFVEKVDTLKEEIRHFSQAIQTNRQTLIHAEAVCPSLKIVSELAK
ncbi:hypothetical protein DID77_04600 [Candidatus Marinamargulisbacteria bacterium SCGC AG-439-L15]|nr:hypothetical protein DID77_04600 [Candidatus Marinamargulisbacteria bacterium SCGC AG-439-L15]